MALDTFKFQAHFRTLKMDLKGSVHFSVPFPNVHAWNKTVSCSVNLTLLIVFIETDAGLTWDTAYYAQV